MRPNDLRQAIDTVDWTHYPGPRYYEPEAVRQWLGSLLRVEDKAEAWKAYNGVLFAIGNNHAGTFYPAALGAVPLLVRITASGLVWPRFGALEILTDLLISFVPERGYEEFEGNPVDLVRALRDAMSAAGLTTVKREPEALIEALDEATAHFRQVDPEYNV